MRAASTLFALALLTGCSAPPATPTTPADPPTAPPETPTSAPEPATVAPPEAAAADLLGHPWVRAEPVKGHGYVDGLSFLGWSRDGTRYAFEITEQPQGAECSGGHSLFVVDASRDAFVPGGRVEVKHDSPEGGPDGCTPKDLGPILAHERTTLLAANDIVAGHLTAPRTLVTLGQSGLVEAGDLRFAFEVLHAPGQDIYGEAAQRGAAYKLVLHPTSGAPRTLEAGTRRRPYVLHYALTGNPLFVSPDGKHAAAVVSRVHTAFEGTRLTWMTNGFAL